MYLNFSKNVFVNYLKHFLFKNHKVFLSFRLLFDFLKTHVPTIFQPTTLVRHSCCTEARLYLMLWPSFLYCPFPYISKPPPFLHTGRKPGEFQWSSLTWSHLEPMKVRMRDFFSRLSTASVDGKQYFSEVVFSALIWFLLKGKWPVPDHTRTPRTHRTCWTLLTVTSTSWSP